MGLLVPLKPTDPDPSASWSTAPAPSTPTFPPSDTLPRVIVPASQHIRVIRSSPDAQALLRTLSDPAWAAAARVLKRDERSTVLRGDTPLGPVVVKSMLARPGLAGVVARATNRTRLARQWRGATLLRDRGFITPTPLALWRGVDAQGRPVESLALTWLEGDTLLHLLARAIEDPTSLDHARRVALATAAGAHVARTLHAGLFNRDGKPSNLLVLAPAPGTAASHGAEPTIAVLDPVGVRPLGLLRRDRARRRMLFSLIVEPIGCGIDVPMRPRMEAMHACVSRLTGTGPGDARRVVREDFRAIDQMLFEHGDPTPRIKPDS
jgi:hypothetical protein